MRIGLILDTFPEISETFLLHHITALLDGGHDVSIFAERPHSASRVHPDVATYDLLSRTTYLDRQPLSSKQVIRVPRAIIQTAGRRGALHVLNPFRYGTGVLRFRALHALRSFSNAHFDILHCHYAPIGWAYLSYRDIFGVPFVTSFHGEHRNSFKAHASLHLRHLFARGDAFIANSAYTRDQIISLGAPAEKVRQIPAPVNDADAQFVDRTHTKERGEPVQLLTVCRLDKAKGVDIAMRAVRALQARGVNAQLEVIGDGPHRAALEEESKSLGVTDRITFAGWRTQAEVYAAYRTADIFVLPTLREAQGVVLQEAMLHGLPVVASDTGGVPESLNFGDAGKLFPKSDADALARAIVEIVDAPEATRAMAHRAVDYVRGRYTKTAVRLAHEQLYTSVLSNVGANRRNASTASVV